MADFLRIVNKRARYDRKRFAKDFARFSQGNDSQPQKKSLHDTSAEADVKLDQLEDELDFFGENQGRADSKTDGKTEEEGGDEAENENEEAEDSDGDGFPQSEAEMKALRKSLGLHVKGTDIPPVVTNFKQLKGRFGVARYLVSNLSEAKPVGFGFQNPTPIQAQAIPCLMSGRDVLACAPTGSGKTVAFCLPMLHKLVAPKKEGIRGLVLTPTAELGQQIKRQILKLARGRAFRIMMLSRANATANTFLNSKKRDVLVATPMRLLKLISKKNIELGSVSYLALDEADRLFEEGFIEQVDEILDACNNPTIQRTLFSATMPQGVEILAKTFLRSPMRIVVGYKNAAAADIAQKLVFVGSEQGKTLAMRQLVHSGLNIPCLCFVQSVERAKQLFNELVFDGINVDMIHSQRTAKQRENVVEAFRTGRVWLLICTDLMARGVDFRGVNCVINYDVPQSTVTYIHRIGRTGRAGRKGEAITFFTENDAKYIQGIAVVVKKSGGEVPDWMLAIRKATKPELSRFQKEAPNRERISRMAAPKKRESGGNEDRVPMTKKQKKAAARRKRRAKRKLGNGAMNEAASGVQDDDEDFSAFN